MKQYFFSIVIPVYNAGKYLKETITSVLKQTYNNLELILIDDGSTDNSYEICKGFASNKIRVYHYENQGQMLARINGIQKANGDFTIVVDADDSLEANCLEEVNKKLNQQFCDMVFFSYRNCNDNLELLEETLFETNCLYMDQQEAIEYIIHNWNHQLWNKAIRTDLLKEGTKETIHDKLKINGDYALIIPVMCNVRTVGILNIPLYNYRIFDGSISHCYSFQHIRDIDYVSKVVMDTLIRHQFDSKEIIDLVMIANVKMLLMVMSGLVLNKSIDSEQLKCFNSLELYSKSHQYLKRKNIGLCDYLASLIYRSNSSYLLFFARFLYFLRNRILENASNL